MNTYPHPPPPPPTPLKKVIEKTKYIINKLSTEYIQQAFIYSSNSFTVFGQDLLIILNNGDDDDDEEEEEEEEEEEKSMP